MTQDANLATPITPAQQNHRFDSIPVTELLDCDQRPVFSVDLNESAASAPCYTNPALRACSSLYPILRNDRDHMGWRSLRAWIAAGDIDGQSLSFNGFSWTTCILRGRWQIVTGNPSDGTVDSIAKVETSWKLPNLVSESPFVTFCNNYDWASTPIGPQSKWTLHLRQLYTLMITMKSPMVILWTSENYMLYNESYGEIAGQKHPSALGTRIGDAFSEAWEDFKPAVDKSLAGQATGVDNQCFFIERNGYLEETFFTYWFSPIYDGEKIVGTWENLYETTTQVLSNRRMTTLLDIGNCTNSLTEMKLLWPALLKGLSDNENDLPQILAYAITEDDNDHKTTLSENSTSLQLTLQWSLGFVESSRAVETINLENTDSDLECCVKRATTSRNPLIIRECESSFPASLFSSPGNRAFNEICKAVAICPLRPTTGENVMGVLIIGLNTRRAVDDDYETFIKLLNRQVETSLASIVLLEEELRRGRNFVEQSQIERLKLSSELRLRTLEAEKLEKRFTNFADNAPLAIGMLDASGEVIYHNQAYRDLTQIDKEHVIRKEDWTALVHPDDLPAVAELIKQTAEEKTRFTQAIRLRRRWKPPLEDDDAILIPATMLVCFYPELNDDGSLNCVITTTIDISQQKYAEALQKQKVDQAIESRRQQENFIDMISHEMRNPLNAILQCAEIISTAIARVQGRFEIDDSDGQLRKDISEASKTITYCGNHQKNIVDDILVLSKLDANLLHINLDRSQPTIVIEKALNMIQPEFTAANITLSMQIGDVYKAEQIDWVLLDEKRLLQVLINLLTNAVKFTKFSATRKIVVTLDASKDRPRDKIPGIKYVDNGIVTDPNERRGPEEIFLHFIVRDTGCGMSEEEMHSLFMRFAQASPKTHVKYGGSGLGLFISRQLAELQGGKIGVASEAGRGSTFAFYIKSTKCPPSSEILEPMSASSTQPLVISGKTRLDKACVLIVEDNIINQKILSKQLRGLGAIVSIANHGQEALEILKVSARWKGKEASGAQLDIILMDIEMPVMGGIACTRRIRELERLDEIRGRIPIIALTANARDKQILNMKEAQVDSVASKPYQLSELSKLIASML